MCILAKPGNVHIRVLQKTRFDYVHMDKVMRIIKENGLIILNQTMELDCIFKISVRRKKYEQVIKLFQDLRCGIEIKYPK